MVTVIFSHPWSGSFNAAILKTIEEKLSKDKRAYQVIDLYKDKFEPAFSTEELALFPKGDTPYALTKKYQQMLKNSTEVIFVFPIWWNSTPAILKGFIDKVMLRGYAWNMDETGWKGLLTFKKVSVITTSESPTEMLRKSIEEVFIGQTLTQIGMGNAVWFHNDETSMGTKEKREAFLEKIKSIV